jgi:hypothetical protein
VRSSIALVFACACGVSGTSASSDAPATGDTWANYASGFAATYCTSCHTPGQQGDPSGVTLDFRTLPDVMTHAAEIRCGVAATRPASCTGFPPPKQFPIAAPYPSDAERGRFVAWIEAGTPP